MLETIQCNFTNLKEKFQINSDETSAKNRKLEFRLYAFLNNKKKSVYDEKRYIQTINRVIKKAAEYEIFIPEFDFFNLGKEDINFLEVIKNEINDKESKLSQINKQENNQAGSALLNQHYIDFVENFQMPNIYWFNVSSEHEYWQNYPPENWKYGRNNDMLRYSISNCKIDDLIIFYQNKKGVEHIGKVYNIDEKYTYFEILCITNKIITLQDIQRIDTLKNYPPQGKYAQMQGDKQIAGVELIVQCFENKQDTKGENNLNSSTKNQKESEKTMNDKKINIPLNQILYGPPGTGKTYNTINKALEILKEYGQIDKIPSDRKEQRKLFEQFFKTNDDEQNKQIEFITFHQNYSYEEFIEGIKPVMDNNEDDKEIKYTIEDGVFKELCKRALKNYKISQDKQGYIQSFNDLIEKFANFIQEQLEDNKEVILKNQVTIKEVKFDSKDNFRSFVLGGSVNSQSLTLDIINRDWQDFTLRKIKSYKDIKPKYKSQRDFHGNANYYFMLYEKMRDFEQNSGYKFEFKKEDLKPYILIIDEINRGNISKILGELITLIEESKRIGNEEELRVSLPYSQKEFDGGKGFGVPNNLYIIGTMNTADRSIALLDTALRRRFSFEEMMPDAEKLSTNCAGVDLKELLTKLNQRIEFLLDREHTIGHAFFIGVNDLDGLKSVFQNKIIPLLQEYFYEDYSKIFAVLNDNKMVETKTMEDLKINLSDELVDSEKKIYEITKPDTWDIKNFQKIYDDTIKLR